MDQMHVVARVTRRALVLFILSAVGLRFASQPAVAQGRGALVVVGGGGVDEAIVARALQLAGGPNAVVAVLPRPRA